MTVLGNAKELIEGVTNDPPKEIGLPLDGLFADSSS